MENNVGEWEKMQARDFLVGGRSGEHLSYLVFWSAVVNITAQKKNTQCYFDQTIYILYLYKHTFTFKQRASFLLSSTSISSASISRWFDGMLDNDWTKRKWRRKKQQVTRAPFFHPFWICMLGTDAICLMPFLLFASILIFACTR